MIDDSYDNRHRQLFEQMEEGFLSAEVLRDRSGTIIDWRFIEVNAAIEKHLGINAAGLVGQLRSHALPERNKWWEQMVAQVIETQQSARLQQHFAGPERWSEIIMFPFGPERFAVLYYDITDKRRQESNAIFLDAVTNELATLSTPEEIMAAIGPMIGEYLKVSSFSFKDIDEPRDKVTIEYGWQEEDLPSLKQTFKLSSYLSEEYSRASQAGQTVIVGDTAHDHRSDAAAYAGLQIGALLTIPFVWQGRWIASTCTASRKPRNWRDEEISLLQQISNRLFSRIDRARAEQAIRRSEEKYRTLFETIDEGFCLIKLLYDQKEQVVDWIYLETNPAFIRQRGVDAVGKKISELDPNLPKDWFAFYGKVAATRNSARKEGFVATIGRWFSVCATPVENSRDVVAIVFENITERKLAEKALQESERQLKELLAQRDELIALLNSRLT